MKHLRRILCLTATFVLLLCLLTVSQAFAQGYQQNEGHPLRYTGRATPSAAQFSFQIFPSNATRVPVVHIQVLVDTIGVWGTDSLVVSFNRDTLASHTIPLQASLIANGLFEQLYGSYANVRSLEFKSNVALKFRVIVD